MDILAHGLWGIALAKVINTRRRAKALEAASENTAPKPISLKWAAWWGMFPDLFAFVIPLVWIFGGALIHGAGFPQFGKPPAGDPNGLAQSAPYQLSYHLYNISHSFVIFFAVALIVYLIIKRIPWEIAPWALHILFDIPTHVAEFFPTPIFWPISHWKFLHGFSWGQPWFMVLNYVAIAITFFLLRHYGNKKGASQVSDSLH
jgi:hypothetical protein